MPTVSVGQSDGLLLLPRYVLHTRPHRFHRRHRGCHLQRAHAARWGHDAVRGHCGRVLRRAVAGDVVLTRLQLHHIDQKLGEIQGG